MKKTISSVIILVLFVSVFIVGTPKVAFANNGELTEYIMMGSNTYNHTIALKKDGTVWAWGRNDSGQLGTGDTIPSTRPVQVIGLDDVKKIAEGASQNLALKDDGTVWAWGNNSHGQLGDGTEESRYTPVKVKGLSDVEDIHIGLTSVALKSDGTVWVWGDNGCGEDGYGSDILTPVKVEGLENIISIVPGYYKFYALKDDGTVWLVDRIYKSPAGFGKLTTPVQMSGLYNIKEISSGIYHIVALKNDGTVWTWGKNYDGQLGDGTTTSRATPKVVSGLNDVISISAGDNHTIALKEDGSLWAWGSNRFGQIGHQLNSDKLIPTRFIGIADINTVKAGGKDTLIFTNDGSIYGFGKSFKVIKNDTTNFSNIKEVSGGYFHTLALTDDGSIWGWGRNGFGELGDDLGMSTSKAYPVKISDKIGFTHVAAGAHYSLALKADGTVWSWGHNNKGQLGDGTYKDKNIPSKINGLEDVVAISACTHHAAALKEDGTVWVWGEYISLPTFASVRTNTPMKIAGLEDIIEIDTSFESVIALKDDGTVWRWGSSLEINPMDGVKYKTYFSEATQIDGLSNIKSIADGGTNMLALKNDGTVWTRGINIEGQLGNGTTVLGTNNPVRVKGLKGVTSISAATDYYAAVKNDGTLWTWGRTPRATKGYTIDAYEIAPVKVEGLSNIIDVSAGKSHITVINNDREAYSWGYNYFGQLGNGSLINSAVPAPVIKNSFTLLLQIGNPYMLVNGVRQEIDPGRGTNPEILDNRTLTPIRAVVEAMGGTAIWDGNEGKAIIEQNSKIIEIWPNKKIIRVDGIDQPIDVAPVLKDGRFRVPLRFVSENLGYDVQWDGEYKRITIYR